MLLCLGLLSVTWADVSLHVSLDAVRPLLKLLAIPFLIAQFRNSENGPLAIRAFLISCTVLLAASLASKFFPSIVTYLGFRYPGVPVKDHIAQDGEFALCGFGLVFWATGIWAQQRYRRATLLALWAALFFVAILYVDPSRTELIVLVVLLVVVSYRALGWRGVGAGFFLATLVFGLAWATSPQLQFRVNHVTWELYQFDKHGRATSAGDRLEFWRKSLGMIRAAPLFGHGVGSTRALFTADVTGAKGSAAAVVTANPHNQIFAIGIELGLVGITALFAMWLAHFRLFRLSVGLPWLGTLIVLQNAVGSLFNSHLYDFTQGWTYVFGIGIFGGLALRATPTGEHRAGESWLADVWPISIRLDRLGKPQGQNTAVSPIDSAARPQTPFGWGFYVRRTVVVAHDLIVTAAALLAAFYIRFADPAALASRENWLLLGLPAFIAIAAGVYAYFGLYTSKWRFASLPDLANIVKAATALSLILLVLDYVLVSRDLYGDFFLGKVTIAVYWVLQIFLLGGPRIAYRLYRHTLTRRAVAPDAIPTLVLGRTADAEILIRAVESGAVKKIRPLGILSPSNADQRQALRGIKVLGRLGDLASVVRQFESRGARIEEVVFTSSALAAENRPDELFRAARGLGLTVWQLPSLEERGEMRLAPVKIEDLLLRPSFDIDYPRLQQFLQGKAVIVTGGGGSIGSELCERVSAFNAGRLLIVDYAEHALYSIMERLKARASSARIDGLIADVRDREQMFRLFQEFRPDVVFHSAALKHVPILEYNCEEAVKTNVFGSINVADAAVAAKATVLVMISTDKAIEPVSVLGASKRMAEIYCQALDADLAEKNADRSRTRLISVRFGNVLASNGSVVPKFKAQIEAGGPVTVTHPDMVRYFMTINEACDLVITAASHALQSERSDAAVYVLEMGKPVRILDLAERMIRLSGLEPGRDIDIVFTGIRPGERLHEILFADRESNIDIGLTGILAAKSVYSSLDEVHRFLKLLEHAIAANDRAAVLDSLHRALPDFGRSNGGGLPPEVRWHPGLTERGGITEPSDKPSWRSDQALDRG